MQHNNNITHFLSTKPFLINKRINFSTFSAVFPEFCWRSKTKIFPLSHQKIRTVGISTVATSRDAGEFDSENEMSCKISGQVATSVRTVFQTLRHRCKVSTQFRPTNPVPKFYGSRCLGPKYSSSTYADTGFLTTISPSGIISQKKINKAYSVLGIIKRNFIYMDERTFTLFYKSMVCPHVEFANSV